MEIGKDIQRAKIIKVGLSFDVTITEACMADQTDLKLSPYCPLKWWRQKSQNFEAALDSLFSLSLLIYLHDKYYYFSHHFTVQSEISRLLQSI